MINSLLSFFLEADRARSLAVTSLDIGYTGSSEVQLIAEQSFAGNEVYVLLKHDLVFHHVHAAGSAVDGAVTGAAAAETLAFSSSSFCACMFNQLR